MATLSVTDHGTAAGVIFNTSHTHVDTGLLDSSSMDALYYPFHLCHDQTLHQLLSNYSVVHFRDFMAVQLTPLVGTTAFPDRMGDYYPDLVKSGRIVQGHQVSGPLNPAMTTAVNRDLADPLWRSLFHEALGHDRYFQRGLVAFSQDSQGRSSVAADSAVLSALQQPEREFAPYTVQTLQAMSRSRMPEDKTLEFEYGFGLMKTSAALLYTIQLCRQLGLTAVTDSAPHHQVLARTCQRDTVELTNFCVKREGY
jgi:hypothetical protein